MNALPNRVDLTGVAMVLAEEDMCRRLADEWHAAGWSLDRVRKQVADQFGACRRADNIWSFVASRIEWIRKYN